MMKAQASGVQGSHEPHTKPPKGGFQGTTSETIIGVFKGDTRSSDYSHMRLQQVRFYLGL